LATNPVYVNGQMASRKGEYFRRELGFNNMSAPVWEQVTVTATGETPVTGNVFVPRTPEPFSYDLDGNMTSDGRWNYTWDAENRLLKVESLSDTPQASWRKVEWTYDPLGRRIRQTTSVWTNNAWAVIEDLKLISDPMLFGRHIVELNAMNNTLVRTYVWGLDLSGTMDGAGGVGGLLWVTLHTDSGPAAGAHFAAYDGNGNVVGLVSATTGTETARYEYGPFAEPIRVNGPAAALNPFRYSTKRTCNTTELVLYEYRAYNPMLGRWLSRDFLDELSQAKYRVVVYVRPWLQDLRHLYAFVGNEAVGSVDVDGRVRWDCAACAAALIGKLGGGFAGCAYGCWEASSENYPFGQCLNECLARHFSACELWKQFKGNPAEWVGAGVCVSCGVHLISARPPGCNECDPKRIRCRPCIPPVGTLMYRIDFVPPSRPHWPYKGTHTHYSTVMQSSVNAPKPCFCFPKQIAVVEGIFPLGMPEVEVTGGGIEYY